MAVKKVNYWDPKGNVQAGYSSGGRTYQDEALTTPIAVGSRVQTGNGDVWQMGQYGGVKVYSPKQINADGTWNPAGNPYYQQMMNAQQQLDAREPFAFDVNNSALYQALKNSAIVNGQRAMQDTMGQAAGLTGGYGSTYSQAAGQQAYNNYLQTLNEQIPDIYAQERAVYDAEGDRLMQRLQLANQMYGQDRSEFESDRAFEYGKEQDALTEAWRQKQWDADQAQQALENNWKSEDRALALVDRYLTYGGEPSDAELQSAGVSRATYNAWRSFVLAQQQASGGSGGSKRGGGGTTPQNGDGHLHSGVVRTVKDYYDLSDTGKAIFRSVPNVQGNELDYIYRAYQQALNNGKITEEQYEVERNWWLKQYGLEEA